MSDLERIRLVILGGQGVGKSCIVKRFLFNTYTDKYKATVEDLYNREYDLGPVSLKVDILDTSGDLQFPAMRRLSIATAHAFILVYSTVCESSFQAVKKCMDEVREQRADFQEIPIVVVGNKLDISTTAKEVSLEDVSEWLYCELPRLKTKIIECSAKDDYNIKDIFRTLLSLSRILPQNSDEPSSGLKRRSSAYVSTSKGGRRVASPSTSEASSSEAGAVGLDIKSKPRSRSLIRRSSRKAKQQMRDAQAEEQCHVS